jgi:hypothetical protein
MRQVLPVVRLQLVNWRFGLGLPVGILALVLTINLALFGAIGDAIPPQGRTTGGLLSIYITFGVGYLQTMTQLFTFALGLCVTRRAYFAGVALLVLVEAFGFGLLVTLLGLAEQASGGWGIGLHFFALDFLTVGDPLLQWLVYTVPFLAFAAVGVFAGVVFKRWGQVGVYGGRRWAPGSPGSRAPRCSPATRWCWRCCWARAAGWPSAGRPRREVGP